MLPEIKGYQVEEEIGEGGFGKVYRAYQPHIERTVAIKAILPVHANQPEFIKRFKTEAQLIARLEHPHIVPLYNYWRDHTGAYLVMRFLSGGNLQELMRKSGGALDLEQISKLLSHITDALSVAHQHDVVHQDIKPENILLDERGNAYLSDFGIAQDLRTGINLAKEEGSNVIHGSPAYISPEHLLQDRVTARSDIYSVGLLLYEMLTGGNPWKATGNTNSHEFLRQRFSIVQLPALQDTNPDLPKGLNDVIWQATARKPAERYADILDIFNDFALCIRQDHYPASPTPSEAATQAKSRPIATIRNLPKKPINPYKGLQAFLGTDAEDFFGRDNLIKQLKTRLEENNADSHFLAVIGPSGSGKSSVVKAGLLPAIRNNQVEGLESPFIAQITPGGNPLRKLEGAVLQVATRIENTHSMRLRTGHYKLSEIIEQVLPPGDKSPFILFIDQFEEIFTLVEDEEARKDFIDKIVEAVTTPKSRVYIIITLRADFYDRPLNYPQLGRLIGVRNEVVLPLTESELTEVIHRPADRVGLVIQDGLADVILRDISQTASSLPLLQYALTELFEKRDGFNLTLNGYKEIGGISGALARRSEAIYAIFDENRQNIARQIFLRLVKMSDQSVATRQRALQSTLLSLQDERSAIQEVMDAFGKYRLLTFDHTPQTREPTVEITHESIIEGWGQLKTWLTESRDELRLQAFLAQMTKDWNEHEHNKDFLATGDRLAQIRPLVKTELLTLTQAERDFLEASIERQKYLDKRRQRRIAILTGITIIAITFALIAIFAGLKAIENRKQAVENERIAQSNALAAEALVNIESLDLSLLLSLEALAIYDTPNARNSLLTGLQSRPKVTAFLNGHTDSLRDIAYNSDGSLIAAGSEDNTVIIWDRETNQPIGDPLVGHTEWVNSVVFNPNGNQLASGSRDGTIILWDIKTGQMMGDPLTGHNGEVRSIAFSPDGTRLASAGVDTTVRLWDTETGEPVGDPLEVHTNEIYALAFNPDGSVLASAGADKTILLWDTTTWEYQALTENKNWIIALAFSPDGQFLVSGGPDKLIHIWDAETGTHLAALSGHNNWIRSLNFHPTNPWLLSVDDDGVVAIWDYSESWQFVDSFNDFQQATIHRAIFSPNSPTIATGGEGDAVIVWYIETPLALGQPLYDHTQQVLSVAFHPTQQLFATSGGLEGETDNDATIRLWDATTGEVLKTLDGHDLWVSALAFNPVQLSQLASASHDGTVIIWDIDTGNPLGTIRAGNALEALSFSPDGKTIALGGNDSNVYLWNIDGPPNTWHQVGSPLEGHGLRVTSVVFSPDGSLIASASNDKTIRLWDVASGQLVGDPLTGHSEFVNTLAFTPDGKLLASGSRDNTIRFWDVASGQSVGNPLDAEGHTFSFTDIVFSPDGEMFASASADNSARADNTIILWDTAQKRPIGNPFLGHSSWVNALAFSTDGNHLVSIGKDGVVILWTVGIQEWQKHACSIANRDFTTEEAKLYLPEGMQRLDCATILADSE